MSAPYPLLQNPLPGYIEPKGASWSGGTFGVTSTLQDHINSGRANGTDMARYPRACGDPVRLMRTGVCYQKYRQPYHNPPQIGDGALIARFRHAEGNTGYAHLQDFGNIVIGGTYKVGTLVGHVGHTGAQNCHLHTHWQDNNKVHHEVYLQLEQSRNIQFNPAKDLASYVNIRTAPGLAGGKWGSARPDGIYKGSVKVAERSLVMLRRHVAKVAKDGFEWMPIHIRNQVEALWVARPFIHFV
jgi:hypothetical protein